MQDMEFFHMGETIAYLREHEAGLSQEQLAHGIMDRGNLSKIESGKQAISKEKLDLLLNRLGYTTKRFFPYALTNKDFKAYTLRYQFNNAQAKRDTEAMEALIAEMESMPLFGKGLHQQHLLANKALLALRQAPPGL